LYKGPDAMRRGTLPRHVRPLMIERPISAVEAIARRAALPRLCSDHRITAGFCRIADTAIIFRILREDRRA